MIARLESPRSFPVPHIIFGDDDICQHTNGCYFVVREKLILRDVVIMLFFFRHAVEIIAFILNGFFGRQLFPVIGFNVRLTSF